MYDASPEYPFIIARIGKGAASSSVELVAEEDVIIIGLSDIELERNKEAVCSDPETLSGMVWHLAAHPDYRRRGVASASWLIAHRFAEKATSCDEI